MSVRRNESSRRRHRSERGAILVLTALASVALVMSAAIAVDVGAQRSKRSQFQAVADGAALLAIYQVNNGFTYQQISDNVKAYVERNLGVAPSAWANCEDVKRLDIFAATDTAASNQCISFRNSAGPGQPNLSRVKIPVVEWAPLFGMGIVQMRVSAVAGAEGAQGVCDEFDLAGCVTTITTTAPPTTLPPPTTTTTTAPPPLCPPPNNQYYDTYWGTWECQPPAPFCPPGHDQWWDAWLNQWMCTPRPVTTTAPPTTAPPSTSSTSSAPTTTKPPAPTTTKPPPPPTSIEIEF